MLSLILI